MFGPCKEALVESAAERPKAAQRVLRLIGRLYQLEAGWDDAAVGDARAALRQEHFALPLKRLRQPALALQDQRLENDHRVPAWPSSRTFRLTLYKGLFERSAKRLEVYTARRSPADRPPGSTLPTPRLLRKRSADFHS